MFCKKCNGEVNLAVGRCTVCGEPVDDAAKSIIFQNLDQLADRYNINYDEPKTQEEAVPEIMKTAAPEPSSPKEKKAEADPYVRPTFDEERFRRLAGITKTADDDTQKEPDSKTDAKDAKEPESDQTKPESKSESELSSEPQPESNAETDTDDDEDYENPFIRAVWTNGIKRGYMWLDKAITPATDRLLAAYRKLVPRKNRVKHSPFKERLAIMLIALGIIAAVVVLIFTITSCIPDNIVGVWQTDELLTIEFTEEKTVIARAVTESGEVCVIKEGTYETKSTDGNSSVIIIYEDGTQSILYYSIDGDTGTFTNITNGKPPATYHRK